MLCGQEHPRWHAENVFEKKLYRGNFSGERASPQPRGIPHVYSVFQRRGNAANIYFWPGATPPWFVEDISLETAETSVLTVYVRANQGAKYPCPICGKSCKAHDYLEISWRHMNSFQHECILKARVPRINCSGHGVRRVQVPWAREGSGFTLLFEQLVLAYARYMPVPSISRLVGETCGRIWRIFSGMWIWPCPK